MVNKACLNILDFSWSLSVTFGLQLSIEVPQFSLEIPLVWSRSAGVGPLRACETGEEKICGELNEAPRRQERKGLCCLVMK